MQTRVSTRIDTRRGRSEADALACSLLLLFLAVTAVILSGFLPMPSTFDLRQLHAETAMGLTQVVRMLGSLAASVAQ